VVLLEPDLRRRLPLTDVTRAPQRRAVLGISALHPQRADCEHLLTRVLAAGASVVACTHLVSSPWRHEALSIEAHPRDLLALVPVVRGLGDQVAAVLLDGENTVTAHGEEARRPGAREAAIAHRDRSGGRAVLFPGVELLTGDVPVAEVVTTTAISRIVSMHGEFDPDAVLVTGGYVRPVFEGGELVLHVGHDDPRRLVPWEVRTPTPCCGEDHVTGPLG
jgi:hypothetical protein